MRNLSCFVALILVAGCLRLGTPASQFQPIDSPDGIHQLVPSVENASVQFDIVDANDEIVHHVNTSASDAMKWAIGWKDAETVVLYSSDIGTYAWTLQDDKSILELPTPVTQDISDFGAELYADKYGKLP